MSCHYPRAREAVLLVAVLVPILLTQAAHTAWADTTTCTTDDTTGSTSTGCFTAAQQTNTLAFLRGFIESMPFLQSKWTGDDFCTWEGLSCEDNTTAFLKIMYESVNGLAGSLPELGDGVDGTQVVPLDIFVRSDKGRLSGTLPASWSRLTQLRSITLIGHAISGTLPASWSAFINLETLDLEGNALTGSLPDAWGALKNLNYFGVGGNQLSGTLPASFSSWGAILQINCSYNEFEGTLPAEWAKLQFEWDLYLDHNHLSGTLPAAWGEWEYAPVMVVLSYNELSGTLPAVWAKMVATTVDLEHNALTGSIPAEWGGALRSIEYFQLKHNNLCGCAPQNYKDEWTTDNFAQFDVDAPLLAADCATANNCDTVYASTTTSTSTSTSTTSTSTTSTTSTTTTTSTTSTTTTTVDPTAPDCIVTDCARCSTLSPLFCERCNDGFVVSSTYTCDPAPETPPPSPDSTTSTVTSSTEAPVPAECHVEGCAACNVHDAYYCKRCQEGYQLTGDFQCCEMAGDAAAVPLCAAAAALAVTVAVHVLMVA